MQEIREYLLKHEAVQSIELPKGARPFATGNDDFSLIALIDPMEKEQTRHQVITVKCGEKLPDGVEATPLQFVEHRGIWLVFIQQH